MSYKELNQCVRAAQKLRESHRDFWLAAKEEQFPEAEERLNRMIKDYENYKKLCVRR